jgi:hypothetical protein
MLKWLPVLVLSIAATVLFALARLWEPLSDVVYRFSPLLPIFHLFGLQTIHDLLVSAFGPGAGLALGTAIGVSGGYFVPYAIAGAVAFHRPLLNLTLGTVVPIVIFTLPDASLSGFAVSSGAFLLASPVLVAAYFIGYRFLRSTVLSKRPPDQRGAA